MSKSENQIYLGIIVIAMGVIMASAMQGMPRPLGLVFIGGGVILACLGMKKKKEEGKRTPGD